VKVQVFFPGNHKGPNTKWVSGTVISCEYGNPEGVHMPDSYTVLLKPRNEELFSFGFGEVAPILSVGPKYIKRDTLGYMRKNKK